MVNVSVFGSVIEQIGRLTPQLTIYVSVLMDDTEGIEVQPHDVHVFFFFRNFLITMNRWWCSQEIESRRWTINK